MAKRPKGAPAATTQADAGSEPSAVAAEADVLVNFDDQDSIPTLRGRPAANPASQPAMAHHAQDPLMEALRLRNRLRKKYFIFNSSTVLHRWDGPDSPDGGPEVRAAVAAEMSGAAGKDA